MKHAFSSLIYTIKHLLANVLSTFVERWLNKYVKQNHQASGDNLMVNPLGKYVLDCVQVEGASNYILLIAEEVRNGQEQES